MRVCFRSWRLEAALRVRQDVRRHQPVAVSVREHLSSGPPTVDTSLMGVVSSAFTSGLMTYIISMITKHINP
jgi:hypothetical protein